MNSFGEQVGSKKGREENSDFGKTWFQMKEEISFANKWEDNCFWTTGVWTTLSPMIWEYIPLFSDEEKPQRKRRSRRVELCPQILPQSYSASLILSEKTDRAFVSNACFCFTRKTSRALVFVCVCFALHGNTRPCLCLLPFEEKRGPNATSPPKKVCTIFLCLISYWCFLSCFWMVRYFLLYDWFFMFYFSTSSLYIHGIQHAFLKPNPNLLSLTHYPPVLTLTISLAVCLPESNLKHEVNENEHWGEGRMVQNWTFETKEHQMSVESRELFHWRQCLLKFFINIIIFIGS
jgi:hypothetical protein